MNYPLANNFQITGPSRYLYIPQYREVTLPIIILSLPYANVEEMMARLTETLMTSKGKTIIIDDMDVFVKQREKQRILTLPPAQPGMTIEIKNTSNTPLTILGGPFVFEDQWKFPEIPDKTVTVSLFYKRSLWQRIKTFLGSNKFYEVVIISLWVILIILSILRVLINYFIK